MRLLPLPLAISPAISLRKLADPSPAELDTHAYRFICCRVCTTELAEAARLAPEFEKRGVQMIGEDHALSLVTLPAQTRPRDPMLQVAVIRIHAWF
jgi:hypothetical protein